MKKVTFLCLLALFANTFVAQAQTKVDSLISVLETQTLKPSEQLPIYKKICSNIGNDREKLMKYAQKGLALAEKEKNKSMMAQFYEYFGMCYNHKAGYDTAAIYFKKALDLAIEAKDIETEASVYIDFGTTYCIQSKYEKGMEYYMKALPIYEKIGDKEGAMIILGNIGSIYHQLNNKDRALYYMEKTKSLAEELNNSKGMCIAYFGLGAIYNEMGEYDKAIDYALKVIEISRSDGNKKYEIGGVEALAEIYSDGLNDYDKAEKYADECLRLAEEYGSPSGIVSALLKLSDVYRKQERYKECKTTALKAWEIDTTNIDTGMAISVNLTIANIYLGNKEEANEYFQKYIEIKTELDNEKVRENLIEMEVKYETEKKEMRIEALEKEKKLHTWLGILAAVFLLTLLLLYINHRRLSKQKIKQLEQEKQLVATQSVLDGETTERKRLAKDLHDGLGGMLSAVKVNLDNLEHLQNARELLDRSIDELRRVAHHLMPASLLRLGLKASLDDFCLSVPNAHFHYYGEDKRLDEKTEILIYRCVHELVNNAVKHSGAENINVQLLQDADRISLTVQDNGCGFDPQTVKEGMGLGNIRTRIAAFNGKIDIYSSQENGTEVYVEIILNK